MKYILALVITLTAWSCNSASNRFYVSQEVTDIGLGDPPFLWTLVADRDYAQYNSKSYVASWADNINTLTDSVKRLRYRQADSICNILNTKQ